MSVTKKINYLDGPIAKSNTYLFNGEVSRDKFFLSLIIHKADSFLPLIKGKIEPLKSGCILFLSYSLFPSSVFFLAFWGLVTLLAAAFFVLVERQWLYAAASLSVGLGNFAFAWTY